MNRMKLFAAAAAVVAFATTAHADLITTASLGTSTYRLYAGANAAHYSWAQANAAVSALGAGWHLATITSAAEQTFITTTVGGNNGGEFWLGATQNSVGQRA